MSLVTQKSDAPLAGGAVAVESKENTPIVADQTAANKRFATLAAQYALAGHGLIKSQAGHGTAPYYATRWGAIQPLESLDAADAFLRRITGRAP